MKAREFSAWFLCALLLSLVMSLWSALSSSNRLLDSCQVSVHTMMMQGVPPHGHTSKTPQTLRRQIEPDDNGADVTP